MASRRRFSGIVLASGLACSGSAIASQAQKQATEIRQNPNIARPITNENFDSAVVNLLQQLVAAYGPIANGNDLPNPYVRIEPFGEPPPGNNGEWAAVTGAEGGPDAMLYVLHRCQSNSCADRPEPAIVKLDPQTGERVAFWGEGLMAFPHGFHVDFAGNVWTTDTGRGDAPGGHLVRKFSSQGELLMTIGEPGIPGDGPDQLREPTDVVVSPEGILFVTEGHLKNGPLAPFKIQCRWKTHRALWKHGARAFTAQRAAWDRDGHRGPSVHRRSRQQPHHDLGSRW